MKKRYDLNSIAGYETEKEELKKIIALFKNYSVYKEKGAYLSKGLILSGEPGVGKTLFAKVLANEINASFIILDGADLNGIFGAMKIKRAFRKAAKKAPSMIFIDELNLFVGDEGYSSDFTQRNLSCLLKLIDGIKENRDIFVVGASSSKEELDEALLRSGRMDKHICINLPDVNSRREIFNYYLSKISLDISKLDLDKAVELTAGLTGADIKTIVNEATLEAINNDCVYLSDRDIYQSITKIKNKDINRDEVVDISTVYHDIGHLILSYRLFKKISDLCTDGKYYVGNSSINYFDNQFDFIKNNMNDYDDYYDDEDENDEIISGEILTEKQAINMLAVRLGGMALEEIYLKNKSVLNYIDLNNAISDIYYMMGSGFFGFKYTSIHNVSDEKPLVGSFRDEIENKKDELLAQAYEISKKIISENLQYIDELMSVYKEKNYISSEDAINVMKKEV